MRATRSAAARSAARGSQVRSAASNVTRVVARGTAPRASARRPATNTVGGTDKAGRRANGTAANGSLSRLVDSTIGAAAKTAMPSVPLTAPVIQHAPLDPRLAKYQGMLTSKRIELTGNLDEVKFDTIARMGRVAEEDQAQLSHEEFISLQRNSMDYAALRLVQRALDRVASGDYGICLECEEPISEKRLQAIPWAEYCVRCQEMHQNGYRGGEDQEDSAPKAQAW